MLGAQKATFYFLNLKNFLKLAPLQKLQQRQKYTRYILGIQFHLIIKKQQTTLGFKFTLPNKHCIREDIKAVIMCIRI